MRVKGVRFPRFTPNRYNMQFADVNNIRLRAQNANSGDIGKCPWSGYPVKAKVGEIRQYWSYIGEKPTLPEGYENESVWHYNWKSLVQDNNCEIIYGENNEHRADIVGNDQTIIEIQKSPIDIRIVRERIEFYQGFSNERMIWIVDATKYFKRTFDIVKKENFFKVIWKNKRQWTYLIAQNPNCHLFLDINHRKNNLLKTWVNKGEIHCRFYNKTCFYDEYLSDCGTCENDETVLRKLISEEKN